MNIAINGFGRIGKTFLRCILLDKKAASKIKVKVINIGPSSTDNIDLLFKHDSIMRTFPGNVSFANNELRIDDYVIKVIAVANPQDAHWKNIDWIVESSGHFTKKEDAMLHIKAGAKKVLITAPAKNEDITIIPGVNDSSYIPNKHNVVSMGSCTTNCFAPIVKVIKEQFGLLNCLMTTIHSYTNTQVLLDIKDSDPRRARAAGLNIIPTKTGAQDVIIKIFPDLEGKVHASALRIPVAIVSLIDFSFEAASPITSDLINNAFKKAATSSLKNILSYTEQPLVSSDFIGDPHSCIIDGQLTKTVGKLGKIFGWYDNEWGYSQRLKDFLLHNN